MRNHFVPKFLLKQFSENGKQISMYNYDQKLYKKLVSVKEQCAKYGIYPDTIEEAFGKLEGAFSNHIKDILDDKYRYGFNPFTKEWLDNDFILYSFINYQYSRTSKAAETLNDMTNESFKIKNRELAKAKNIDLDKVRLSDKNAHMKMITNSITSHVALFDLKIKILKNCTELDFIISDNPISPYNQLAMFHPKCSMLKGSQVGLTQIGLQLFVPISPKFTLILYDLRDYQVGEDEKNFIELSKDEDIVSINKIIACYAGKCIYFKDVNSLGMEPAAYYKFKSESGNFQEDKMTEGETYKREDGRFEKTLLFEMGGVMAKIDLSFSKLISEPRFQKNFPLLDVRSPDLVKVMISYDEFIKEEIRLKRELNIKK